MSELVYNAATGSLIERETVVENTPFTIIAELKKEGIMAEYCDFDYIDDLWVFDKDKYNDRIDKEEKELKYENNKKYLNRISEDIVQALAGVEIADIKEKMNLFCTALNETRAYEGKPAKTFKLN